MLSRAKNEIDLFMHRLNRFFLEHGEFHWFSVIHVSQGSVATYVRCGGMSTPHCIANFLMSLAVKEFLKSVKIWQSYCQNLGASFFLEHGVEQTQLLLISEKRNWTTVSRWRVLPLNYTPNMGEQPDSNRHFVIYCHHVFIHFTAQSLSINIVPCSI